MVFKVPAPAGHLKKNRFEFQLGDETLSIPKMEFFTIEAEEWAMKAATDPTILRRAYIIGLFAACDPEVGEKIEAARLTRDQLGALYDAWGEASKVDPEKSSRSADS